MNHVCKILLQTQSRIQRVNYKMKSSNLLCMNIIKQDY